MAKKIVDLIKTKLNEWITEPVGDVGIVTDSAKTELKQPNKSFKVPTPGKFIKSTRGRGDKREIPHPIVEFHPLGAAGRREVRGPQSAHKATMPHKGNHPRYPK